MADGARSRCPCPPPPSAVPPCVFGSEAGSILELEYWMSEGESSSGGGAGGGVRDTLEIPLGSILLIVS